MTVPTVSKTYDGLNRDDYIRSLTSRHPVSASFFEAMLPTIDAIFRDVPESMSRSLANFANESFRRRSEVEQQLNTLNQISGVHSPKEASMSRREKPVHKRDKKRLTRQSCASRAS